MRKGTDVTGLSGQAGFTGNRCILGTGHVTGNIDFPREGCRGGVARPSMPAAPGVVAQTASRARGAVRKEEDEECGRGVQARGVE